MHMKPYDWAEEETATALEPGTSASSSHRVGNALAGKDAAAWLAQCGAGKALLQDIAEALAGGDPRTVFDLAGLGKEDLTLIEEVLGVGEVSIIIDGAERIRIQESVMAGLWRVRGGSSDYVEIGDVPGVVRQAALERMSPELPIGAPPDGIMNVMPVLAEIRERMAADRPGAATHVINFTLFPMNEADMAFLQRSLGLGPIRMLSRGYGTCRITATARFPVWSVQYLNAMDTVILDTLEIGDVPTAACAAREDIEDSAIRLREILEAYL
jgi:hydrogenase-1 operon protein HyaF